MSHIYNATSAAANQTYVGPDGLPRSKGLIPRNFSTHPSGCHASVPTFPKDWIIPKNERASRLKDQQQEKSSLLNLREDNYESLKSLDQDSLGLCWAFSSTKAVMYMHAKMGPAPLILSAWWVAGKVKAWRDEGGWGLESAQQISDHGVPDMALCPSYSSKYDTDAVAQAAKKHLMLQFYDGTDDPATNQDIQESAALLGFSWAEDHNWWSHSVCGCYLKDLGVVVIDNSWSESAGDKGLYTLEGAHARPDNIVVCCVVAA